MVIDKIKVGVENMLLYHVNYACGHDEWEKFEELTKDEVKEIGYANLMLGLNVFIMCKECLNKKKKEKNE